MAVGTIGTQAAKKPSIWSGFFGKVTGGIASGLEKVGQTVLPNWVQSQVDQQKADQLRQATYDAQQKRVETAKGAPIQQAAEMVRAPLFKVGGFQFRATHALLAVGGLLTVWLVMRLAR